MKSLRKSILTLLALTLFGGAGAWAQGPTQVTQFTTDLIASWQNDNSDVTLADMQALGFGAVDVSVAQAWTGAPQGEYSVLIYGFDGTYFNYIVFDDNGDASTPSHSGYSKSGLYNMIAHDTKHFFTSSPAIELTKEGANQWTLGQAPDYDLELQVEYYEAHALKNIPAGWQVKVNGVDKTAAIDGDSLMITETDSVTLVPAGNPRRVKSVTLEEVVSLAPPLTMEALTAGTIVVNMDEGSLTMKYSKNGGAKTTITATTTITVAAGDKVAFYGNGTSTTAYGNSPEVSLKGTAKTKVYGNIMSLVDETGYATARTLSGSYVFFGLFMDNTKLTDASGLLLPATTLAKACYSKMFYGCTTLTAAPELPATTLADFCYASMFSGCNALETAPALPATTLVKNSYAQMFYNCSKLSSVTCLATSISAGNCLYQWLQGAGSSAATKTLHVKASMGSASWNNGSFTVTPDQP